MGQLRKDNSSFKLPSQIILHGSKINFFFLNIMLLCNYFYLFMCVCVWPHRWKLCVCRCPRQPKESSRTLGTETIGGCEMPNTRMRSKRSWSLSHVSKPCCKLTLETNHQPSYWLKKKKKKIFCYIYLFSGGRVIPCIHVEVREQFVSNSSLHYVGPKDQTQVIRLGR